MILYRILGIGGVILGALLWGIYQAAQWFREATR